MQWADTSSEALGPVDDPVRVLHVDDDDAFRELTVAFLERQGLTVLTEPSAEAGLDRLDADRVDCIVSDYDMPEMDGLAFLEAVRDRFPDLPFVLFTGRGNEEVASDAISAGVSDYLQKGGSGEQYELLANRVRNYVEQYRMRHEVETVRRRYELAGRVVSDVIYEHDVPADETVYVGDTDTIFGYDSSSVGETQWWIDSIHPDDRERVLDRLHEATSTGESSVSVEYRLRAADGSYRYLSDNRHIEYADGEPRRIVGAFRDVTDRRRRVTRLDALNDAARELIGATTVDAVVTIASEAAETVLDMPINAIYLREGDRLAPAAATDRTVDVLGSLPEMGPGESIMWDVHETGASEHFADVRESDRVYNPETPVRSEFYAPIGEFGVFVAASTAVDDFEALDVRLAQVLAANVEAALDRLDDA